MNNSISDWNLINFEKNALERIIEKVENNEKTNKKILENLDRIENKVDKVIKKIELNNFKIDIKEDDKKEEKGIKIIENDEILRMRNNAWRQSNKLKLLGVSNNSYITTPNIPLNFFK